MSSNTSITPTTIARAALLRKTTQSFCAAFLASTPPSETLDQYFRPDGPKITEYGPEWASRRLPFLGKTFSGRRKRGRNDSEGNEAGSGKGDGESAVGDVEEKEEVRKTGRKASTCDEYFDLLGATLGFHPDEHTFPPPSAFIVDPNFSLPPSQSSSSTTSTSHSLTGPPPPDQTANSNHDETVPEAIEIALDGAVSVTAHARFSSLATGHSWSETFTYRLSEFDAQGRIGHWEIWADPLSAWMAVGEGE
ncbi:MAG: hypothetical protein M1827_004301 [Pycnora praestabilis]|nr:MAG: hypothetical protein M1827_004301 [Pycnora praestabilis]